MISDFQYCTYVSSTRQSHPLTDDFCVVAESRLCFHILLDEEGRDTQAKMVRFLALFVMQLQ